MIARIATVAALAAAIAATAAVAQADQQYATSGEDVYGVGQVPVVSRVTYDGTQRLTVEREAHDTRYDAQARYVRADDAGQTVLTARFVQVLLRGGSFEDRLDDDPDFLTILNQPFAVQLDAATLHDVRTLRTKVPFVATPPVGSGAMLHGFLRPAPAGAVDGRPAAGIRFEAEGPMTGTLPQRAGSTIAGHMRMDGVAYYALDGATLLALKATLTIDARLRERTQSLPVRIVYRRWIRAVSSAPAIKTPLPAPPATGAATASPALR